MRFPFSRFHFGLKSAQLACIGVWLIGISIAAIPLLIPTWTFYGQTGLCIPLPITRRNFPGRTYSFYIVIVLNFVLFLIISLGQVVILFSVKANAMTTAMTGSQQQNRKNQETRIARRLLTVAISDFLCWFPIGLLGLLASQGVPISGEINVAMAVIVLPLNSALNPFLYTINVILEHRRKIKEDRLREQIKAQINVGLAHKV